MILFKYFYKVVWFFCFWIKNLIYTNIFKIKLFLLGIDFGKDVHALGGACPQLRINKNAQVVKIGNGVIFNSYNDVAWNSKSSIWVKEGASLIIGDNSGFNGAFVYASNYIKIGNNVKIGGCVRIFDTDFHPLDYRIRRLSNEGTKNAPIIIDDDVFIGACSIILKGVTIGKKSIVAAGSIVTKSIPENQMWGGNPAKFIKNL